MPGRIRLEAKAAIIAVRKIDGTRPSPRTVNPKKIGAGRMNSIPRHAIGPTGSPATRVAWMNDNEAEQNENDRKNEGEIAGAHAEGRPEVKVPRLVPEKQPDRDEEGAADAIGGVDADRFHER